MQKVANLENNPDGLDIKRTKNKKGNGRKGRKTQSIFLNKVIFHSIRMKSYGRYSPLLEGFVMCTKIQLIS